MRLLYGGWPLRGGCLNIKQPSTELCVYCSLSITKYYNIEFELFSIACSTGQYFPVFAQLSWVNTEFFSIPPAELSLSGK